MIVFFNWQNGDSSNKFAGFCGVVFGFINESDCFNSYKYLWSVPYVLYAKTAKSITSSRGLSIGDTYQGGIIFYLDASGCQG